MTDPAAPMSYIKLLRFVAAKTERTDDRVAAMMDLLLEAADAFEATGVYDVPSEHVSLAARAFAGVAAFLQQQILPSAIATQNASGENQIRWAIEAAMTSVNSLLIRAASIDGSSAILSFDGKISR